jgi:hypothetical protein
MTRTDMSKTNGSIEGYMVPCRVTDSDQRYVGSKQPVLQCIYNSPIDSKLSIKLGKWRYFERFWFNISNRLLILDISSLPCSDVILLFKIARSLIHHASWYWPELYQTSNVFHGTHAPAHLLLTHAYGRPKGCHLSPLKLLYRAAVLLLRSIPRSICD